MLRVGLLGIGDAGAHHARALIAAQAEGLVTWSAVASRDIVKTAARCAELGMPTETRVVSPDELLAGELCEAVIIAMPDGLHREHAITALANGLHVLVEKPLALTVSDGNDLVAMARDKDRVLQVGYHHRHHAGHELVHRELPALVGSLCTIFIRWARPDLLVRDDGSRPHADGTRWWSLAALGTDGIDLALGFAAGAVTDAVCVRNPQRGIDRAAEVSLRFTGGPLAHISVSVGHRARSIVLLTGTDGEIECLNTLGGHGAGTILHRTADSLRGVLLRPNAPERSLAFVAEDSYLRQLRAFAARCGEGRMKIDAHAITNLEVLDRITPPRASVP
jgi:predicted dehydrogenase